MSGIVVVGSINVDLIFPCARIPGPGETLSARRHETAPGGKGANQAVAAARQGAPVTMIGAVGTDDFASDALALLKDADVDLDHVLAVDDNTGLAIVYVSDDGENSILIEAGANAAMTAEAVENVREVIADADLLIGQGEIPVEGLEAAVEYLPGRLVLNLAPVIDVSKETLRRADPLVVNEHEGALVLENLGVTPPADDADVVATLLAQGIPSVIMTRGAAGAFVGVGDDLTSVPSARITSVDSTGAGDAFVGALSARLLAGDDLVTATRHAVRVGAFACLSRGAQPSYPWTTDTLPE